jgi:hypothetical protein
MQLVLPHYQSFKLYIRLTDVSVVLLIVTPNTMGLSKWLSVDCSRPEDDISSSLIPIKQSINVRQRARLQWPKL